MPLNDSIAGFRLACHSPYGRFAAWSSLTVSELSAATPLWSFHWAASLSSWIEVNCLRSATLGKAASISIDWLDAAHRLVFSLRQVALAQLYKITMKEAMWRAASYSESSVILCCLSSLKCNCFICNSTFNLINFPHMFLSIFPRGCWCEDNTNLCSIHLWVVTNTRNTDRYY